MGREATQFKPWNKAASKFKTEYIEKMYEYFNRPATKVEDVPIYDKNGDISRVEKQVIPCEYPTFEMFASEIGVTPLTLRHWCEENDRFNACYAWAKERQKGVLLVNTIGGHYNQNFAKFIAINCHGMQDKVVSEVQPAIRIELSDEVDEEAN